MRFAQAYLMLARCKYRPAAPSDGFGNIQLSPEQCRDEERQYAEAVTYAMRFAREDDDQVFNIGCSNYTSNRAFVLVSKRRGCSAAAATESCSPHGCCARRSRKSSRYRGLKNTQQGR
jgi:hypothetical protein